VKGYQGGGGGKRLMGLVLGSRPIFENASAASNNARFKSGQK